MISAALMTLLFLILLSILLIVFHYRNKNFCANQY